MSAGRWTFAALLVATCAWLPSVHLFFAPKGDEGAALLARQRALLAEPAAEAATHEHLRRTNPEWDLMRRTFLALSLLDDALAEPARRDEDLRLVDGLIDALLADDRASGPYVFLLPYAHARRFVFEDKSLFVDGEIALVLAARQLVGPRPELDAELAARVATIERLMGAGPARSGESYPDEAWTFCNTTALAALRLADARSGAHHDELATAWLDYAKAHLVDPANGLLVSSYTYEGRVLDGPEGSTIFMVAHNLLLWDEDFASDQFARAKRELSYDVLGFSLVREWPRASTSRADIDSGPIVPLLEASAGASGMAVLGAAAFHDQGLQEGLWRSMYFAAFPQRTDGTLRFRASNELGDAVMTYAGSFGPLWALARGQGREARR